VLLLAITEEEKQPIRDWRHGFFVEEVGFLLFFVLIM
jgi:hypothetical protein